MAGEVVGQRITRVDGYAKVRGEALYPQDIYMENMLFGKTVRSTKAHAYIKIDKTAAENIQGVIKILTYEDVPGQNRHGVLFKDHEVFCERKVRRIGDPMAFVIAQSEKIAQKASEQIQVHYEELEVLSDPIEAMKEGAPKIHDKDNSVYHYKLRKGNVEEAFKGCAVVVENTYRTSMAEHAFLQPEAGIAYMEGEDTVVVCAATQYPHFDQIEIAEALNIPSEKVKVITPAVGGAFGGREDITLQIHLAIAAKLTGRPVKTVYSREESFNAHCKRHPFIMTYKTGADEKGRLLAMEAEIIGDTGAYASWAINVLRKAGVHATGPYDIPNVKVDSYAVYTNNPFAGAMRGFGATQPPVAYEQQIEIIAQKLHIDPVDIRLRNIFKKGLETATGQVLVESIPLDTCIKEVSKQMNFITTSKPNGKKKRGSGLANIFYGTGYGNGFPDVSRAEVELQRDGTIKIFVGATEVGQGAKTALTQIAAETLGVCVKDIVLICEDTSVTPDSGTAAASRQTYNTGNAIKKASEKLRDKINGVAVGALGLNSDIGISINQRKVYVKTLPNKAITLKDIAEIAGDKRLRETGSFIAQTTEMDSETGQGAPYWPYTFSACGVEVEVDIETGKVEVLRGVLAQDVGKAVNPSMIEGQMDGGFAMGLGFALLEDLNIEQGRIRNNSFTHYLIPTSLDLPEIKKIIVEDPESTAPYGAKGIGEPVMIPVAPAILNAIADAIGVRIKEIPVTPEKIMKALRQRRGDHEGKS